MRLSEKAPSQKPLQVLIAYTHTHANAHAQAHAQIAQSCCMQTPSRDASSRILYLLADHQQHPSCHCHPEAAVCLHENTQSGTDQCNSVPSGSPLPPASFQHQSRGTERVQLLRIIVWHDCIAAACPTTQGRSAGMQSTWHQPVHGMTTHNKVLPSHSSQLALHRLSTWATHSRYLLSMHIRQALPQNS